MKMENKINFLFLAIFLLNLSLSFSVEPQGVQAPLTINEPIRASLPDKSYAYYILKLSDINPDGSKFLLFEARRNEDQDLQDNIFSDPNLYISTSDLYPDPNHNTWSSSRFGDEIISVNKDYVKPGEIFYVSVYCEFKCNYIIDAKLYNHYEMKEEKLYTISMIPDDVIKATFKTKKNFETLKINCISSKMKPFRIFLAKKDPSSSNTLPSNPIFLNGYYFLIQKGDKNYATEQEFELLIENKEYKQDLLFWLTYDYEDIEISELSPLFGTASENSGNCYLFKIDQQHRDKNLIISTTLFNGNGYIKVGGWEKVQDMKVKTEDKDTYAIISDKSILLTQENFKNYPSFDFKKKILDFHFCFIATEETSYAIKVYFQENAELAQKINFLLPGVGTDDMLPGNNVTKYRLFYFEQNKDIKINLKIKNGKPKLFAIFSYDENFYVNKTILEDLRKSSTIYESTELHYRNYELRINKEENRCLMQPIKNDKECRMFAIIWCDNDANCLYELLFDHVGDTINMLPKVLYSNVITENEVDKYQIRINDDNIKNIAVVLTQTTGISKLKFIRYITENGEINSEYSSQFNKEYMPNILEIKSKDLFYNNIKGVFELEVIGYSFSSYSIYYYVFDDESSNKLDHKTISMALTKGTIIKDYIKENHNLKVYSYDNSNVVGGNTDLFIYIDSSFNSLFQIYVFANLNDYSYENKKVKGFKYQSRYTNYIHIPKDDPNYIKGNLYIMVYLRRYNDNQYSKVVYRNDNPSESEFLLAITDDSTPLTLMEGIEFRVSLTKKKQFQLFNYNHQNKDENFILSMNIPFGKVKLGLKMDGADYIYEKVINDKYYLQIETDDIRNYCPSDKSCNIDIRVDGVNIQDLDADLQIVMLCKSSKNSFVYLNRNAQIEQRRISHDEKQYFVIDANPVEGYALKINAIFNYGRGILYANKAKKNEIIQEIYFPNEDNFEYSSEYAVDNEEISIITIPYEDLKDELPCQILVTVKGSFQYLGKNQGDYSISVANVVDDIFPNKNYRLFSLKSEIKYYHFTIKGNKKRLSISMTNKQVDGQMYLNYATLNKDMSEFQWKSEGSYNEYIDISVDDSFFVSRKIKSVDGDYYLAVRIFKDSYFNLFIADSDIKITTITEDFPGTCRCDKEGDICYFRYENINSPFLADVMEQEIVFYFDFTYGSAEISANLYPHGNNEIILNSLTKRVTPDFKSLLSNKYLKVFLTPDFKNPKYTIDSILILTTKCKTKSLFDFNVRPLLRGGDIVTKYDGVYYLSMDKDNIFYLSPSSLPLRLTLYSTTNYPISFEAKAIEGSANVHYYIDNGENPSYDEHNPNKIKGYKHLNEFTVSTDDKTSKFDSISNDESFRQNLYFEVTARTNCLFSLHLHYSHDPLLLPMSKEMQGKFENGKFYAYVELLKEYEEIIFSVEKMNPESKYSVYAKTSIVNSLNFKMMFSYSAPSDNNYDLKATSNPFTSTISLKIRNVPKELYTTGKKVITIFYIVAENRISYNDKFNMISYPNVNHFEIIHPQPNKYIFSSISSKDVDKTVFNFQRQEKQNNLMVVEISACKGNFHYELTNTLNTNPQYQTNSHINSQRVNGKGKSTIVFQIYYNIEYYLSVYGIKEDEILFGDNINSTDIDFLLYYYSTNEKDYNKTEFDSKLDYVIRGPGDILLKLPKLETVNSKNNKMRIDDLNISLIITENENEFDYMDSICYLTRKYDMIESHNLYKNYSISINKNKYTIEITKLSNRKHYYMNVLITNKKTGEIFALNPVEIKPHILVVTKRFAVTFIIIAIVVLFFVMFYFYRKFRIAKAIVNYEKNDIKNMGSIPKSITELKKIQEEKNKKAKEKYNSLTEDSGQI